MGPLQVGATVSQKYKVVRLLAESGGVVLYEATDTARSQRVWIKILQREALNDPDAMARFQREAGGAKVLDVGKNDAGLPYLVATEFKSDTQKPPLPKKTTLPGVAPPPPPLPRDEEPPPSSGIPLLADDVEIISDRPPPVEIVSPLMAAPAALSPLITTPPAPLERDEPSEEPSAEADSATVPLPTIPMAPKKPVSAPPTPTKTSSTTPTVFIERPREKNTTGMWLGAMAVVASISGIIGYSMAQKNEPHTIVQEPTATATATATETVPVAATTTTTVMATPAPTVITTTAATDTVTPAPTVTATATTTATTATATATAVAVAPAVTATTPAATQTQTATHPVVRPPATHKPPPANTHASSGDPLTL